MTGYSQCASVTAQLAFNSYIWSPGRGLSATDRKEKTMFRTIAEKLVCPAVFIVIGLAYTYCVYTFAFVTAIG